MDITEKPDMKPDDDRQNSGIAGEVTEVSDPIVSGASGEITIQAAKDSYWANLKVTWLWGGDGKTFTCTTVAYQAKDNGRWKGNVRILVEAETTKKWEQELLDGALQNGQYHDLNRTRTVSANATWMRITFGYKYDRANVSDVDMHSSVQVAYYPPIPLIDPIKNFSASTFNVTGGGGVDGALLALHNGDGTIGTGTVQSNGRWSVPVTVGNSVKQLSFQANQRVGSTYSDRTGFVSVFRAALTYPTAGAVVPMKDFVYEAIGAPGSAMYALGMHWNDQYSEQELVDSSGRWQAPSTHVFPSGDAVVRTRYYDDPAGSAYGYTNEVRFKVLGYPGITDPGNNTQQEQTFTVSGKNRLANASVQVFIDTTSTSVGTAPAAASATWSASVKLQPGVRRVAAEQFISGKQSGRGSSVLYRVRPDKPALLSRPKGEGVEFYGTGYPTGRMHIHVSGDGVNSIDVDIPASGIYTKDLPATVVPGNYRYTGRQSVSDGATGRIYSSGWTTEIAVNVPTPVPTGGTATPNGQRATFIGRGNQWGAPEVKIGIYNNGVALANVPQATVRSDLGWSTTATADLPPGNYPNLTARQWVNNQWSADSTKFSMTIPTSSPEFTLPEAGAITGQRPRISGKAWPGAAVVLKIPGKPDVSLTATGGNFVLDAAADWAPRTYTLQATAAFGGTQPSAPASRTFTVKTPKAIITTAPGAEVGLATEIEGTGWPGCWVGVYLALTSALLGESIVRDDRNWTVLLPERQPGDLTFFVIQKEIRDSPNAADKTADVTVKVGVPQAVITVPADGGRAARKSIFSGSTTARTGTIELFLKGQTIPLVKDIQMDSTGVWETPVEFSQVGLKTLEIKVRQGSYLSAATERTFTVVPNIPQIDTPLMGERLGKSLKIFGFGFPGDDIRIDRRGNYTYLTTAQVTPERTWSASVVHNMVEGNAISAMAIFPGSDLSSDYSNHYSYTLLEPAPQITEPQAADYVGVRPWFSGLAIADAIITIASWFNTDEVLASTQADKNGRWTVQCSKDLPVGPARVAVCQTTAQGKESEWAISPRFIVERVTTLDFPAVAEPRAGQEVGLKPMFVCTGEPGAALEIVKNNQASMVLVTTRVDRDGNWAAQSEQTLPLGDFSFSARQSRDGVFSPWMPYRTIKVIQAPAGFAKPIITQPLNDPNQVLERRPIFAGRGMPGAELRIYRNTTLDVYATTRVDARGNWSVRCAVELPVQTAAHQIAARQSIDGQDSQWSGIAISFKVANKLNPPEFISPVNDADVSTHMVVRGTALPGSEVRIHKGGDGNNIWGRGVADEEGRWIVVVSVPTGTFSFTAKAVKGDDISGWAVARTVNVVDMG
ncbi:hypothetical protein [Pseudomonas kribbensis]|uniref:Ig-like domain repeat protein n=1 Tax=Pseudomonas kribbensis TaxID=1628086 RepID=A0A4Y8VBM5_9PSED|nr:hypothetical protein [Pseudomonas kribbensis]TFH78262.1 hypothetical protein E4J90_22005 [Pseudomonas kribbensis]